MAVGEGAKLEEMDLTDTVGAGVGIAGDWMARVTDGGLPDVGDTSPVALATTCLYARSNHLNCSALSIRCSWSTARRDIPGTCILFAVAKSLSDRTLKCTKIRATTTSSSVAIEESVKLRVEIARNCQPRILQSSVMSRHVT